MDSLTHIASGALIGEAFFGRKLGRRAMVIGALAQSIPDIDFVASFWLDPADDLLAHRGITHSFLFGAAISVLLAIVAARSHRNHTLSASRWMVFFLAELGTHLFLDAFNNYGVGWFEPFSAHRISFNTIFVIDPFYSIPLVVAFVALLIHSQKSIRRRGWVITGLLISSCYLLYTLYHKVEVDRLVRKNIAEQHLKNLGYFSTPTIFNNWLWYIVVRDSSGFQIGYHSVFDHQGAIAFKRFQRQESLLIPLRDRRDVKKLIEFSQEYYTVENNRDTLTFNDLRFGQIAGWTDPAAPFVFHYYLNHPDANALVVQRGRFEGWNVRTLSQLVDRIRGRPTARDSFQ